MQSQRGARLLGFVGGAWAGRFAWNAALVEGLVDAVPISKIASQLESLDAELIRTPDFSKMKTPDFSGFSLPEVTMPDLPDVSSFQAPDFSNLKAPDMRGLNVPDLSGVRAPDLSGFKLPDLGLKAPDLSGFTAPDLAGLSLPKVTLPDLSLWNLDALRDSLPEVKMPESLPEVKIPELPPMDLTLSGYQKLPFSFNLGPERAWAADGIEVSERLAAIKAPDFSGFSVPVLPDLFSLGVPDLSELATSAGPVLESASSDALNALGATSGELWAPLVCGLFGALSLGTLAERDDALGAAVCTLGEITDFFATAVALPTVKAAVSVSTGAVVGLFVGAFVGPLNLISAVNDITRRSIQEKVEALAALPGKFSSAVTSTVSGTASSLSTAVSEAPAQISLTRLEEREASPEDVQNGRL